MFERKKYKPTKIPFAMSVTKANGLGWGLLAAIVEYNLISDSGDDYWCCGYTSCGSPIQIKNNVIPKVCTKCGNEIDWIGIKTRVIKVCPTCSRTGTLTDIFCDRHVPAVELEKREIPL